MNKNEEPNERTLLFAQILGCYVLELDAPDDTYLNLVICRGDDNNQIPDVFYISYPMMKNMSEGYYICREPILMEISKQIEKMKEEKELWK